MFREFSSVAEVRVADPFALADALCDYSPEDLANLPADEAEIAVAATQRVINAMAARQAAAVVAFTGEVTEDLDRHAAELRTLDDERRAAALAAGRPDPGQGRRLHGLPGADQVSAAMLAPILELSPRTMVTRVHRAWRLVTELPATFERACSGDLEPYRCDAVVRESACVAPELLVEFETRLYAVEPTGLPYSALKQRAAKAALRTDPEGAERSRRQARVGRRVRVGPGDAPGMSRWEAHLPTGVSDRMWAAVERLADEYLRADEAQTARGVEVEPRSVDAARADAFGDLLLANADVKTVVELVLPATPPATEEPLAEFGWSGGITVPGPDEDDPMVFDQPAHSAFGTSSAPATDEERPEADVGEPPGTDPADEKPGSPAPPADRKMNDGPCAGPPSVVDRELVGVLQPYLEIWDNPRLGGRPGAVWFIPNAAVDTRCGLILPDTIAAILDDPDTTIRVRRPVGDDATGDDPATDDPVKRPGGRRSGRGRAEAAYRPGRALARAVRSRDGTCRFPGCGTAAGHADLDHVVRYPDGPTCAANLVTLCRVHHAFKHHAGWTLTMTPDGICTWTAPNGRTHVTRPPDLHDAAA